MPHADNQKKIKQAVRTTPKEGFEWLHCDCGGQRKRTHGHYLLASNMRKSGMLYREIGEIFNVGRDRARMLVLRAERIAIRASFYA